MNLTGLLVLILKTTFVFLNRFVCLEESSFFEGNSIFPDKRVQKLPSSEFFEAFPWPYRVGSVVSSSHWWWHFSKPVTVFLFHFVRWWINILFVSNILQGGRIQFRIRCPSTKIYANDWESVRGARPKCNSLSISKFMSSSFYKYFNCSWAKN